MMPLYNMSRGIHYQGIPRGVPGLYSSIDHTGALPGSVECSDDDTDGGYDSVRSIPSLSDDRNDRFDVDADPDYMDTYLGSDIGRQEVVGSSDSEGEGRSLASGSSRLAVGSRLVDMGIFDLEFSEPPDLIGEDHTDDDSHDTDSDGELSGMNSDEDDDDGYGFLGEEVAKPPQLPAVSEERLQKVWTLGDESFSIFLCPITHEVMTDPVVSADGYTYERSAIARWFETSRKSPVTGQTLPHIDLVPNQSVRTLLKTLIDMTDDSEKQSIIAEQVAEKKLTTIAPSACTLHTSPTGSPLSSLPQGSSASSVSTAVPSSISTGAMTPTSNVSVTQIFQSEGTPLVRRRATGDGRLESLPPGDSLPPPPSILPTDRRSSAASDSRLNRGFEVGVAAVAAAIVGNSSVSQTGSLSPMHQRQHRPTTNQGRDEVSPTPSDQLRGQSSGNTSRPSSQPQPNSQPLADSANGARPQSSSGCPQQRSQAPSTALPPLRMGQTPTRSPPPAPPEPGVRGGSPPLVVPPISNRSPTHTRLPAQAPPFPSPVECVEAHSSLGQRHDNDESSVALAETMHYSIHRRSNSTVGLDHA